MGSAPVSKTGNGISRSIVWLDASIRSAPPYINSERLLCTPKNYLKTFKDDIVCEKYIRSVPKEHRIILIVDGKYGQLIVPRIHQLIQVTAIFIHSMDKKNEKWTKKYKKVKDVIEEIDELVPEVLSTQEKQISRRERFEEPLLINIYNTSSNRDQSKSETNNKFVHSQKSIYGLLQKRPASTERDEFITYCNKEYGSNRQQLPIIREFEQNYSAGSALKWYTRDCFLYKLLNKALRMQNIKLLDLLGFFIRDLYHQLKKNQYSKLINVYRSQLISKQEVQQLKNSIGQLISINSFLSTTPDREAAIIFLNDTAPLKSDFHSVLFEIQADPQIVGDKPFADITSLSYMPHEKEVLMMLGSIFRLVRIHQDGTLYVIHLVLYSENGPDVKPVFDQIKIDSHPKGNTNTGVFGKMSPQTGSVDETARRGRRGTYKPSSDRKSGISNAVNSRVHYKYSVDMGSGKGSHNKRIIGLPKGPEIKPNTSKKNDPSVAEIHHDTGRDYYANREYKQALESYNKALTINRHTFNDDHFQVAESYSKVASIHAKNGQYTEALYYMQKMLDIREKHLPKNHDVLGLSHTNMADIYRHLHKYNLSLQHYNIALRIYKNCLPAGHHNFGIIYNGIGSVHLDKHNDQAALAHFEKAAAIFRQTEQPDHPDAVDVQRNIDELRKRK